MRLLLVAVLALAAPAARAEMRNEEHLVGDKVVRIAVSGTIERMTVGPSDPVQIQVLSGADIEILAFVADADSVALVGGPVLVAEVTGTHSCEAGDPRAYYVVTLGDLPAAEGPVTSCEVLVPSLTSGAVVMAADPMGDAGAWAWVPGKGWGDRAE